MKKAKVFQLLAFMAFAVLGINAVFAAIIPSVPDVQQPPAGSLGNPVTNACAPVSAVNITQYWDVVMGHPNASMVNAGLVPTTAADYLYYFMNTNDWPMPGPPRMNGTPPMFPSAPGTYNIDIQPGFFEFVRWDAANLFMTPPPALPATKLGYSWNFSTDFATGFAFHKAEIDSGRPDIVSFTYWNPVLTPVKIYDPALGDTVYFYMFGPPMSGSIPPNPIENWNSNTGPEGIGHAVTGIGYYANYSPGGGLPVTNWIVCHDNWPTTRVNVAIPWTNWKSTIAANPGEMTNPPDSLYWKDFNGPLVADGYMPDFDQKQDFTGDGIWDPGYCGPTSVANSLWWFQGKYLGRRTVIDPMFYPGNPLGFIQLLAMLMRTNTGLPPNNLNGTYVDSMQAGIAHYLQMMNLTDLLYEHTIYRPTFDTVEFEIERCQDVTLLIGFWVVLEAYEQFPGQWMVVWKRTGGHYVTAAGVNSRDRFIGISDPYYDNVESGVTWGVLRGANHNHPMGHNDGVSASHDIYNINDTLVCSPGGLWEFDHAFWQQPGLQSEFARQNEDTLIVALPWLCPRPPVVGELYSEVEAAVIVSPYPEAPKINVVPDTLSYVQLVNTTNTYTDQIIICNNGTASLMVDSVRCDLSWVGTSFLPIVLAAGACDTIDVSVNTNGVAAGAYSGNFHVYSNDPLNPVVNKPHIRVVVTAPDIDIRPDSLGYVQLVNTIQTYTDQILIWNLGDFLLNVDSLKCDLSFVTVGFTPIAIPAGACDTLDLTINTNGRLPGPYSGFCHVYSDDPDEAIVNKPKITVRITAPNIRVIPDSLYHSQPINTFNTYPADFSIGNLGDGNLQILSATTTLPWITLTGVPPIIIPLGNVPINVNVNTGGIAAGIYLDSVTITSNDPNRPIYRKPKIVILVTAPSIRVSPESLYHSQQTNINNTYNNDFTISNIGNSNLQIFGATNTLPWITLIGIPGMIPPTTNVPINVNVNTTGIAPGVYLDSVTITSNDPIKPILRKPKIVIRVTQPQQVDSLFWKDYNGPQVPEGYLPDFDQNQDFTNDGLVDQGYCGPVAVANSFWWYQGKYPGTQVVPPGFYPGNPVGFVNMLSLMMKTNGTANPGTDVDTMQTGIRQYIQLMHLDSLFYEHTIKQPTFDTIVTELVRSQDITLLIGIWYIEDVIPGGPGQWLVNWRRTGGHYVTVAGINRQEQLIGISDPDADNFEIGACSGVLRGLNHAHPTGHNDGISASHDIYDIGMPPCSPGGLWELDHAYWRGPHLLTRYANQNGGMYTQVVPWPCPQIEPIVGAIYSEIEAAVIVSPKQPISCAYKPGDINSDDQIIGGDVTYGVRYFKAIGNPPPDSCWNDSSQAYLYAAGDVNGNCEFRGSDITFLVAYFKSVQPALMWCRWTPPIVMPPALIRDGDKAIQPVRVIPTESK
jgi:hypothetical protein